MSIVKKLFFLLSFIALGLAARAATGCKSLASNYLYDNNSGTFRNTYPVYEKSPRVLSSAVYCRVNTGQTCYIRTTDPDERDGCPRSGSYYFQEGDLYTYNTVNQCPLDGHVALMAVAFAGIGGFLVRKKALLAL